MSTAFIAPDGDPTSRERESRAEAVFRRARERKEEEIRSALRQEIASGIRRDSAAMEEPERAAALNIAARIEGREWG